MCAIWTGSPKGFQRSALEPRLLVYNLFRLMQKISGHTSSGDVLSLLRIRGVGRLPYIETALRKIKQIYLKESYYYATIDKKATVDTKDKN